MYVLYIEIINYTLDPGRTKLIFILVKNLTKSKAILNEGTTSNC